MPQEQTQFDSGKPLLTQAKKAPVQGLMQALDSFQEQSAKFQRAENLRDLTSQATKDARKALVDGSELPQTKDKFLRSDLTDAYNKASRQVFKMKDALEMQAEIDRLEKDYRVGDIQDVETADQFAAHVRKHFDKMLSHKYSSSAYGPEYAQDLTHAMEASIAESYQGLVNVDIQREEQRAKSDVDFIVNKSAAGYKDLLLKELFKIDFTDQKQLDNLYKTLGSQYAGELRQMAVEFTETFGTSPTLEKYIQDSNDIVKDDLFAAMINSLLQDGRVSDANKIIESFYSGKHYDDNKIIAPLRDKVRNMYKGYGGEVNQRWKQVHRMDQINTPLQSQLSGFYIPIVSTVSHIRRLAGNVVNLQAMALNGPSAAIRKEAGELMDILRVEVAQSKLMQGDVNNLLALTKDPADHAILKSMYNAPESMTFMGEANQNKNLDAIKNMRSEFASQPPEVLYDIMHGQHRLELAADGVTPLGKDSFEPQVVQYTMKQAGGDLTTAQVLLSDRLFNQMDETSVKSNQHLPASKRSKNRRMASNFKKGLGNQIGQAIQAYRQDASDANLQHLLHVTGATQDAVSRFNPGESLHTFKLLSKEVPELAEFAGVLDGFNDIKVLGQEVARPWLDAAVRGKNLPKDAVPGFPASASVFFAHPDAKDILPSVDKFGAMANMGQINPAFRELAYYRALDYATQNLEVEGARTDIASIAKLVKNEISSMSGNANKITIPNSNDESVSILVPKTLDEGQREMAQSWMKDTHDYSFIKNIVDPNQLKNQRDNPIIITWDSANRMHLFAIDHRSRRPVRLRLGQNVQGGNIMSTGLTTSDLVNTKMGQPIVIDKFDPDAAKRKKRKAYQPNADWMEWPEQWSMDDVGEAKQIGAKATSLATEIDSIKSADPTFEFDNDRFKKDIKFLEDAVQYLDISVGKATDKAQDKAKKLAYHGGKLVEPVLPGGRIASKAVYNFVTKMDAIVDRFEDYFTELESRVNFSEDLRETFGTTGELEKGELGSFAVPLPGTDKKLRGQILPKNFKEDKFVQDYNEVVRLWKRLKDYLDFATEVDF